MRGQRGKEAGMEGRSIRKFFRQTILGAWNRKGGAQSTKKGGKGYRRRPKHQGRQES
jgi:hypothetical protein